MDDSSNCRLVSGLCFGTLAVKGSPKPLVLNERFASQNIILKVKSGVVTGCSSTKHKMMRSKSPEE